MDELGIRSYLKEQLEELFPTVMFYYSPSGNMSLSRPCVVCTLSNHRPAFALSQPYQIGKEYSLMFLSDIPGLEGTDKVYSIPNINVLSTRSYVVEDIHHMVFNVAVNSIK